MGGLASGMMKIVGFRPRLRTGGGGSCALGKVGGTDVSMRFDCTCTCTGTRRVSLTANSGGQGPAAKANRPGQQVSNGLGKSSCNQIMETLLLLVEAGASITQVSYIFSDQKLE
jgi:hypothetical protein